MTVRRFPFALCAALAVVQMIAPAVSAKELKALSVKTFTGFGYPESVAYDPSERVLYVGDFVSALEPAEKDGKGKINKVSLALARDFKGPADLTAIPNKKGCWSSCLTWQRANCVSCNWANNRTAERAIAPP